MKPLFLLLVLALGGAAREAAAATIYVTYLDPRPISSGPGCSLQEAIYSSILHDSLDGGAHGIAIDQTDPDDFEVTDCVPGSGNDTIVLPTNGVLHFDAIVDGDAYNPYGPTATPIIFSNITIEGRGATLLWVGSGPARLFAVGPASITTPHGTASGTGNLTLRDVYVENFNAAGGNGGPGGGGGMGAGGAIYVQSGGLTIENSTFRGNAAVGGNGVRATTFSIPGFGPGFTFTGGGGGIAGSGGPVFGGGGGARGNGGRATITLCDDGSGGGGGGGTVFPGGDSVNCNGSDGVGGASGLYCGGNGGDLGNDGHPGGCPGGGGGGSGAPTADVFTCGPDGGRGNYGGGGGGGVCKGGSGGFGGGGGGGTDNGGSGGFGGGGGGAADDSAAGNGGAFGGDAASGGRGNNSFGGGGAALGGAIFNDGGSVTIRNSTFTGNTAVPGVGAPFTVERIAKAAGGTIFSRNGSLLIVDSTISGNAATNSRANVNGGVSVIADGAAASFELDDTIIAGNGVAECLVWRSVSASGTNNLIADNTVPGFPSASKELPAAACPGVTVTADPQLQPLADNGGYTQTMAIPFGSAAMSAADSTTSFATDQRGEARPQAGGWDIGAYTVCRRRIGLMLMPFFCSETTNPGPNGTSPLMMAVSSDTAGTVSPPPGSTDEPNQSVVVMSAKPEPGYIFVGWSGNVTDPTSPTTTIVINQTEAVTANFALEETGFVPPDKATAACENGVAADLTKLSAAIAACHVKAGDAAFKEQDFGEEVCEQTARTAYDAATAKLKGCPPCLDATTLGTLAVQAETTLDQHDAEIHCAGTAPLDNDDGGFVPPDRASRTCEDGVGKSAAKLLACLARCHAKTVSQAVKGKPFDEEACETTDATKSCRAKYDAAVGKVLASTRVPCPACLGTAQAAQLGDETERDADAIRGAIYCAGTQDLTR